MKKSELEELGFKLIFGHLNEIHRGDMYLLEIDDDIDILYCTNGGFYIEKPSRERILNNIKTIEDVKKLIELLK